MGIGLRRLGMQSFAWPRMDPVGYLLRLDADYRDRRRLSEMGAERLADVGLTVADIDRILRRG